MCNVSTGYKVLEVDQLLSVSKYLWTFDDLNDIKDLQGESWAQISGSLQSTTGVRGRAVKALGGAGFIELIKDAALLLANPLPHSCVTLSLWLSYEIQIPNVVQTFFAAGYRPCCSFSHCKKNATNARIYYGKFSVHSNNRR